MITNRWTRSIENVEVTIVEQYGCLYMAKAEGILLEGNAYNTAIPILFSPIFTTRLEVIRYMRDKILQEGDKWYESSKFV